MMRLNLPCFDDWFVTLLWAGAGYRVEAPCPPALIFHIPSFFIFLPIVVEDSHSGSPIALPDPVEGLRSGIGLILVLGEKSSVHAGIQAATPPFPVLIVPISA
jgi:hypothetical protein